ncbi:MAG: DUF1761 domain-containing protein [Patescibacteria group bacterium]
MVDVNYVAIVVCAVLSMVIGSVWYGPMFGKKWMEITGADKYDLAKRKEMQKKAMPLYGIQFVLSLIQAYIFAQYIVIGSLIDISGVLNGFLVWLAFIMPTVAGSSMWNNNSNKIKWAQFGIQAGYQLVLLLVFGAILFAW